MANKNLGSFLAFSEAWFTKHQGTLLWLLNHAFTKRWFRWILRIRKHDCPLETEITELKPNRFSYGDHFEKINGKWHYIKTTDFRTHPKFAKRIYYAFRPFWWLVHFWDWAIADRFVPKLSFGFDVLTAYPDPDPETSSMDGYSAIDGVSSSWATLHDGTDGNDANASGTAAPVVSIRASTTLNQYQGLYRCAFLFDTSSIDDAATVSSAIFSVYGTGKTDTPGWTPNVNVYTSTPASNTNITTADYDQFGTTAQCDTAITYSGWSTTGYNDFTLNATGRGNVSKTGISKFATRNAQYDVANSAPTYYNGGNYSELDGYFADQTGTTNDPKLVVTYSTSTAYTKTLDETLVLTASELNKNSRTFAETLTLTATLTAGKVLVAIYSETLAITDTFLRTISKVFSETLSITASIINTASRTFSETLTLTETLIRTTSKVFSETLSLTETKRILLNGLSTIWSALTKHTSTYTNRSRNSSTHTNRAKNSSTWTNRNKS